MEKGPINTIHGVKSSLFAQSRLYANRVNRLASLLVLFHALDIKLSFLVI
jgi:hypothetical protein